MRSRRSTLWHHNARRVGCEAGHDATLPWRCSNQIRVAGQRNAGYSQTCHEGFERILTAGGPRAAIGVIAAEDATGFGIIAGNA